MEPNSSEQQSRGDPVDFQCPMCRKGFTVGDIFWSDQVPCPHCGYESDVELLYEQKWDRMEQRIYLEDEQFKITNMRFTAADVRKGLISLGGFHPKTFLIEELKSVELWKEPRTFFPRIYWLIVKTDTQTYTIGMPALGKKYAERVARALDNAIIMHGNPQKRMESK